MVFPDIVCGDIGRVRRWVQDRSTPTRPIPCHMHDAADDDVTVAPDMVDEVIGGGLDDELARAALFAVTSTPREMHKAVAAARIAAATLSAAGSLLSEM
ncbi:MAG TPA: hypothetical protein VGF56_12395 [Rhizomicrobium sp.]|jgi:hypothetical protein